MPSALPHELYDQIQKDGFAVVRGFLSQDEIDKYLPAAERAIELSREGKWSQVRTRGKQFPPWPKNFSPDIWGVSGLLDPKWGDLDPALPPIFQDFYAQPKLLDAASDSLQVERSGLVMELLNMLINPLTDFGLDWHRDDIKPEATAEEELAKLSLPETGTQFNLALRDDACLIVIPGTHKRARNAEERAKTAGESRQEDIAGQLLVELKPGDCVFYNNNILHRATYNSKIPRVTLHGSYGHAVNGKSRSTMVLQHGVADWLPQFKPTNPDLVHLKAGLEKIVDENKGKPVQYSLDG